MLSSGSFGSRWLAVAMAAVGVAVACGEKADDDLFQDTGVGAKRGSGGSAASTSGGSSGGSPSIGTGGKITGGSGALGGAAGSAGGFSPSIGGKISGSSGAGGSSAGKNSGGVSQGGANVSGGAGVVGSSGGSTTVAGSEQGGAASSKGGASGSAGSAGDGSVGAGGADGGARTIQIKSLLDAWVDECNPDTNTGSEHTLSVDSDPCVFEIYIKPSSLSEIPAGATVESALLELQCVDAGNAVHVHAITGEWSEESVDWETRPGVGDEIGSFTANAGPVVIEITSLVRDWLDGAPMNGVALVQNTETDGSDYPSAESGEDEAPRLLVTYTP